MYAVSDYLKRINSILPQDEDVNVTLLDEGFSNKVYKISWAGVPRLVMRIPGLDARRFHIDRDVERQVWGQMYEQNLTSRILWHDDEGVVVSEFLNGETFSWEVTHSNETLSLIEHLVVTMHRMPSIDHEYNVFTLLSDWLDQIAVHERFHEVAPYWQHAQLCLERLHRPIRPKALMLCHNDLIPKNFITQPARLWLIDWENAGMNDPLFDLAVLVHSHHLNERQLHTLVDRVLPTPLSQSDQVNITWYRQAYVLRELVWLLLKELTAPQDLNCLEWYHSLLHNPRFNPYFTTLAHN